MTKLFNQIQFENELKLRFEKTQLDIKDRVFEAAAYSLFSGGKRLRPKLLQMSYKLFTDADIDMCRPFQFAIEMIHSYSLIHDDLPAMDDDSLRRGKPSCHIVFGEATAILAGDLLLNAAYEIMAETCLAYTDKRCLYAMNVIAGASGGRGMILGQSRDLAFEKISSVTAAEIEDMQMLKTSALIRAALLAGAILGGCNSKEQDLIYQFGSKLGLSFQIRDDLLDAIASTEDLGKSTGKDERDNKKTYVTVLGIDRANQRLAELSKDAKIILLKLEKLNRIDTSELRILTDQLETRQM
ncbi:MAG: polyprenyl synthetase family protein [Clostridiaceae bacterium]|nr:polyprenyl synthetase family protein [Clostridiaceae bacterium]